VTFDDRGICNACRWEEEKKHKVDWAARQSKLRELLEGVSREGAQWDVIVPCSGGKDGSYVAWKLKHEYGANPLCVTFAPQLQTRLGRTNLENFRSSGFDHITITPDNGAYRKYSREWFEMRGMPKQPFVVGISTAVLRVAYGLGIRLVMYGEQGEREYGGGDTKVTRFTPDFLINTYYEGQGDSERYGPWWKAPTKDELDNGVATWWSEYEDWDPDTHARLAKEKCGMELMVGGSIGTFTNASQLDDAMQDLHCYLMYLKFGFGRCTADACIEIRKGRMTREQGVKVVGKLDGTFPWEYLPVYLDYFNMREVEFWKVIDSLANKGLLVRGKDSSKPWVLKNEIWSRIGEIGEIGGEECV